MRRKFRARLSSLLLLPAALCAQNLDTLVISWDGVTTWADGAVMADPLADVSFYNVYVRIKGEPPGQSMNLNPITVSALGRARWKTYVDLQPGVYTVTVTAWGNKIDRTKPKESAHSSAFDFTFPLGAAVAPTAPGDVFVKVKPAQN